MLDHASVRWTPGVTDAERADLERRFQLTDGEYGEGTTWKYQLADPSTANIRALIQHERVDDTAYLNRIRYRPEFGQDRTRQILVYSVALGSIGSLLLEAARTHDWTHQVIRKDYMHPSPIPLQRMFKNAISLANLRVSPGVWRALAD